MKPMLPKRTRRLRARAATLNTQDSEFDDYGPEPNMKLSHAFLVVLLLHVIAVGGIYAFNSYKAEKAPKLVTGKMIPASGQPADPSNPQGDQDNPKPQDPQNTPPSQEKPSIVAKSAELPSVKGEAHKGVFAEVKAALLRVMGHGVSASVATATVATAAAQESTNSAVTTQPEGTTSTSPVAPAPPETPALPRPTSYVVKSGDTITKISALLGVTILDVEKANGLTGSSVLQVGENLKVPEKGIAGTSPVAAAATESPAPGDAMATAPQQAPNAAAPPEAAPVAGDAAGMKDYTVVKGDNPYKIAKKFKISTAELMKANNITDPKKIQIGQKLKIPASTKASAKAPK